MFTTTATRLYRTITGAGIPLAGVSLPTMDRATWRIDFHPDVTDAQRAQAQAIVAAFDATEPAPETPMTIEDVLALLRAKGVITQQDIAQARANREGGNGRRG
jgi:hypothetical protein